MSSFVVNCFNFTLKATCHLDNGMKVEIDRLSPKHIAEAIQKTGVDSITLIGPQSVIEKMKEEILKLVNIDIITLGGSNG